MGKNQTLPDNIGVTLSNCFSAEALTNQHHMDRVFNSTSGCMYALKLCCCEAKNCLVLSHQISYLQIKLSSKQKINFSHSSSYFFTNLRALHASINIFKWIQFKERIFITLVNRRPLLLSEQISQNFPNVLFE